MVNFFIYARDYSGSTKGNAYFHKNGLKTVEDFKRYVELINEDLIASGEPETVSKIIYLHWGDHCYKVTESETIGAYNNFRGGYMRTEPKSIINWMRKKHGICNAKNKIKLMYIVTDGMINRNTAEECFVLNENINYEIVVFHAFNESLDAIDLSVASSFLKNRCLIYRNHKIHDDIDISKEYDYNKITLDNFESEKDNLVSYIRIKFIKASKEDARALREIEKLKKLRYRLFAELLAKSPHQKINLETKDRDVFLNEFKTTNWYQSLMNPYQDLKVDIEKLISSLINYIVNDQRSYSFDALKFNMTFKNTVAQEAIIDVNFSTDQEIQFPDIILDDEKGIPVIILFKLNLLDKIIYHETKHSEEVSSTSFNKFKSTMDCPLFLLNDQDISESIGYFYTMKVYKQLLRNTVKTEPRTRKRFHGGLVLVDSDEFDKYNDYIISATYFTFKKVNYNIGLFYYVLWKNCENKEWMDRNVVERFKKYVMRRISGTVCKISLSSLPLDPPEKTSLLTALWYCVELSSYIFKNDSKHFFQERLRMFYSVAHSMIEILQYFNYNLDLNGIEKRIDLIRNVMALKRISKREEKIYYLLEKIFKKVNGFLVCEIENPFNLSKLNCLKFDHRDMLSDDVLEEKVNLNDYVYLLHFVDNFCESRNDEDRFEICENTFRPFFIVAQDKSFYSELVNITKKVIINNADDPDKIKITHESVESLEFDRVLSLYNLFLNSVKDFEKYPTFQEYLDYILAKKKFHDNLVTIFQPNVYFAAEKIYSDYQNVVSKVNVGKFIYVSKRFAGRFERIKAEGVVKLTDADINKFVTDEESKVSLKKNSL